MQHLARLPLAVGSWHTASACDLSWELPASAGDALSALSPSHLYVTGIASQMPPPPNTHNPPSHPVTHISIPCTLLTWPCPAPPLVLSIAGEGWGLPSPVPRETLVMLEPCPPVRRYEPHGQALFSSCRRPPQAVTCGAHGPGRW